MVVSHGRKQISLKNFNVSLASHYVPDISDIIEDFAPQRRSLFGRKKGKTLTGVRANAMKTLFPKLNIPENILTEQKNLTPEEILGKSYKSYILEIGFGQGERLAQQMQQEQVNGFLGAEYFLNGMAAFMHNIEDRPHENIRVLMGDGLIIVKSLKNNSLDAIYVLNPDPWHKARHHKRRIINQESLTEFSRVLKPNGDLIMSTDVPDLTDWMVTQTSLHPNFTWQAQCAADWQKPPENWIETRYETKGAKGAKKMTYLIFKKTCKA